jgi:hypothetical protein
VGTIWGRTTGVVTNQEILGAYRHPKMRILRASVWIFTGSTASNVSITNGATTMVTAVAANVAAIGNDTQLTIISNTDVVLESSSISVTTSGANDVFLWLLEFELTE